MSTGLYTHRTRNAGEIVRDTLYNPAHKNHQTNDVPNMAGALSDDTTEFQTVLDPAPGDVPAPVLDVASEFQQLRYAIADIKTTLAGTPVAWYEPLVLAPTIQRGRGARVYRSTSQSIPFSARTAITFDTIRYDTGVTDAAVDPFFVIGSPTRLTAKAPGLYQLTGFVEWNVSATGPLAVAIRLNGTGRLLAVVEWASNGDASASWQAVSTQYELALNDYVELIVLQGANNPTFTCLFADFALELLNPTVVIAPPATFTLTVSEIGTGSGTITTDTGGISCPGTCAASYADGATVLLTATPSVGGFTEWSGDVPPGHETDNPLSVTMDQARTIAARFTAYTLNISEAGTGAGLVTSDVGGISCPGTCSAQYAPGDIVQLTAVATVGSFTGWTGDLTSSSNPDSITMNADSTVVANFAMTGVWASLLVSANIVGTRYIIPTSVGQVSSTLSAVQFKLPIDVQLISLSVTMASALAGGHTIDFRFNVGGVDDNSIVASLIAGDVDKQADGAITVAADTLISVKAVQSGGGGDNLQSLTIVYRPL